MKEETKHIIVTELRGSQTGAIVACALGVELPGARFTSKAVVTSDGYLQANFVGNDEVAHHSAFVGSFGDLETNIADAIRFLKECSGLSDEDADELRTAVLSDWIAADFR